MKNFFESLKDILYDSMDYIIMIAIVAGVVSVIGWRLDILFAKDAMDTINPGIIVEEIDPNNKSEEDDIIAKVQDAKKDPNAEKDLDSEENEDTIDSEDNPVKEGEKPEDKENPNEATPESITVNIPEGSLPSKIGSILESNGVVESKNDFVQKAQDMDLDRKFRAGNYTFDKNNTLEDVIKIIARQN